jgi:hypothetical protein
MYKIFLIKKETIEHCLNRKRIKHLDQDMDTNRFRLKTRIMNRHFINELNRIGLQLINMTGTFDGKLLVLLETKVS